MSEPTRIIGIGAGGHARVVLDILHATGGYTIVGLLDADPRKLGQVVAGATVIGDESKLADLRSQGISHAFVGAGGNTDTSVRERLYKLLRAHDFTVICAIHPSTVIAPSATLGDGVTVMAGAIVNPDVAVGCHVTLNTGCIIEHDCTLADHAFIGPGAVLAGGVHIDAAAFIGAGAVILPGLTVGARAIVGAGAVVTAHVPPLTTVAGVPATSTATSPRQRLV